MHRLISFFYVVVVFGGGGVVVSFHSFVDDINFKAISLFIDFLRALMN